jgi:hypothetical protein
VPVVPNAIDHPQPVTLLLAPATPLPEHKGDRRPTRPQTGEANAPHAQAIFENATAEIRGVIGSTATVGGNAAHIGAPGLAGMAQSEGQYNQSAALQHIGKHVDARA